MELTSKDRILIPTAARQKVSWLAQGNQNQILAEVQGHAVELRPWAPAGDDLLTRLRAATADLDPEQVTDLVIAAMDCFARLNIGEDGRVVLPTHLSHFLVTTYGEVVRLVVCNDRIWLWPETRWSEGRNQRNIQLSSVINSPHRSFK